MSVREQAAILVERLRRHPSATFRSLTADCDTTLLVVARFLALLELYRDGAVAFDQMSPLGELHVRWTGSSDGEVTVLAQEYEGAELEPEPEPSAEVTEADIFVRIADISSRSGADAGQSEDHSQSDEENA